MIIYTDLILILPTKNKLAPILNTVNSQNSKIAFAVPKKLVSMLNVMLEASVAPTVLWSVDFIPYIGAFAISATGAAAAQQRLTVFRDINKPCLRFKTRC